MVVLLLLEQLRAELQRLELVRVVVEVDGCGGLLQEFSALHSNLRIVLFICRASHSFKRLQLVDTVALVWLILLCQDDLLQTHRCFSCARDERLVEACHIMVRYFDRPEPGHGQNILIGGTTFALIFL